MTEYIVFEPSVKPLCKESNEDFYFIFKNNDLLIKMENNKLEIPRYKDIVDRNYNIFNKQCMGKYRKVNCYSGESKEDLEYENLKFIHLREYSSIISEEEFLLASKGKLLLDWYKRNQYCGFCGSKMYIKDDHFERSMICEHCRSATWPRTSPAILVAIVRDNKILLGNNKNFPEGLYSVLAGFVEYGETFEQCVKREVYEEVGIEIENIEYFGSKPWPFPNSMMIAYTAEYKSGEIKVDDDELVHAAWFDMENLPEIFLNKNSIASDLIDHYKKKIEL